eukprot:3574992-Heterocapsa_arctica.AAC.1
MVPADGGILAGCGFSVHYLKATITVDVKEEGKELRDFVDDMVLSKETPTAIDSVKGIVEDLGHTESKLRAIGQRLNDTKEQIFVPFESTAIIFRKQIPNYKGKVGQAVVDLGITHRTHKRASFNK